MEVGRSVKVGGVVYSVEQVDGLHDDGDKLSGSIRYNDCVIRLETGDSVQAQWQTVWHEALHAILHQAGRKVDDHTLLDLLGYGVMQLLCDNRWLRGLPRVEAVERQNGGD